MSSIPAERVLGFAPIVQRRSGFLGLKVETFTVMVTPSRLVFASISDQEMKEAVAEARAKAKEQGKGMLGQWGAQFAWVSIVCERLAAMPVESILATRAGSFTLDHSTIKRVKVEVNAGDEDTQSSTRLVIETQSGKHSYELAQGSSRQVTTLLKQALGAVVK